jgi:hypothetical protein
VADCGRYAGGSRRKVRVPQVAVRDERVAIVLAVPVEECVACGDVWLNERTAQRLTSMFREILANPVEISIRRFDADATATWQRDDPSPRPTFSRPGHLSRRARYLSPSAGSTPRSGRPALVRADEDRLFR